MSADDVAPPQPRWRQWNVPAIAAGTFVVAIIAAVALADPAGDIDGTTTGGDGPVTTLDLSSGLATGPTLVVTADPDDPENPDDSNGTTSVAADPAQAGTDQTDTRPGSVGGQWWYETDFDESPGSEWSLYFSPGHAGWGLRRPETIEVVDDPGAGDGRSLRIRATMGQDGDQAGLLVSGGMALIGYEQTYGRYEFRMRVDGDPARVTSGVALLWPASGDWPAEGEINMFESWNQRDTRDPIESNVHRLSGDAQPPFDLADVESIQVIHDDVDGSEWHTYLLEWRPERITLSVDGGEPRILTDDPGFVPGRDMRPTFQLDAFDAPDKPGVQPVLQQPVALYVDYFRVDPLP